MNKKIDACIAAAKRTTGVMSAIWTAHAVALIKLRNQRTLTKIRA